MVKVYEQNKDGKYEFKWEKPQCNGKGKVPKGIGVHLGGSSGRWKTD
jgi:hypothetical protein